MRGFGGWHPAAGDGDFLVGGDEFPADFCDDFRPFHPGDNAHIHTVEPKGLLA